MNKKQMLFSAAFVALAALSGVSRADDVSTSEGSEGSANVPMTCTQASQYAWFMHELEQSDGSYSNTVDQPVECQRELIAKDAEVLAAIHSAVTENE
jgi:hypothetical protein